MNNKCFSIIFSLVILSILCNTFLSCSKNDSEDSTNEEETKPLAYDFAMKNNDGITIYYRVINEGSELEVRSKGDGTTGHYKGKIEIPEDVTYKNRLYKVTRIGNHAFAGCDELTSLTIPNSMKSFELQCFSGCENLNKIIVHDVATICGIKKFDADANPFLYARLYSDDNTEIENLVIPNHVTTIEDAAFANCSSIKTISMSNSVKSVGECAFSGCINLSSVTIGKGVVSIGTCAFSDCRNLLNVTIPKNVTSMGSSVFLNCKSLTHVFIESGFSRIENGTFASCESLSYVEIPNSVTSIGTRSFMNCTNLFHFVIPNSVNTIEYEAFQGCDNVTSITIGKGVKSIEASAFNCQKLVIVISLIEEPFEINYNVFDSNTRWKGILWVPHGTIEKYKETDGWKEFGKIAEGDGKS